MAYLTAGVVLVGLLCLLDLVLVYGVIRRLRQAEAPSKRPDVRTVVQAGDVVAPFRAIDTTGRPLSLEAVPEGMTVMFLAPWCAACEELLPLVAERAAAYGPDRLLAVIEEDPKEDAGALEEYLERLSPVARVVVVRDGDELTEAFAVTGLPAYVEMGADGVVARSGRTLPRRTDRVQVGS
ncbi:hypothetical protein ABZX75_25395 [Streptomyces sp. NPDC003038]|uniref:TlpA family protein disulfide reductase n=1 Tax=unclassified Streptomyces TaxID=2593676 RepID=UPI0033A4C32D